MCMCGDLYCGSCGPAQGFDPVWEGLLDACTEHFDTKTIEWTEEFYNDCVKAFDAGYAGDPSPSDEVLKWIYDAGAEEAAEHRAEIYSIDEFISADEEVKGYTNTLS